MHIHQDLMGHCQVSQKYSVYLEAVYLKVVLPTFNIIVHISLAFPSLNTSSICFNKGKALVAI